MIVVKPDRGSNWTNTNTSPVRSTLNTLPLVEIQIQIQLRHLWGRQWTHSFSWKPSSSSVLNFFPQPRHTFVCERKSWEFVSRLRCWFNVFQWAKTLWVRACRARPSSFSQFWERKTESCKPQKCRSFFKTFQNLYLEEKLWWDKPDHIENIQDRSDRVGSGHGSPDVEYAFVLFSRFSNEARNLDDTPIFDRPFYFWLVDWLIARGVQRTKEPNSPLRPRCR